jgi:hypothetical protein
MKAAPAARTCSPGGRPDRRKIPGHHKLVLTIEAARAAGPVLAAYLSAHSAMINGSALCAALAVTERDRPCWPDRGQTDQNADYLLMPRYVHDRVPTLRTASYDPEMACRMSACSPSHSGIGAFAAAPLGLCTG